MKIIKEKLENNPFLIAVHRGSSMGNIVENTISSVFGGSPSRHRYFGN